MDGRLNPRRDLLLTACVLAALVAIALGGARPHPAATPPAPALQAAPSPATVSDGLPADLDALPPTAAGPATTGAVAQALARLEASDRPQDAYLAYRLLASCAAYRDAALAGTSAGAPHDCDGIATTAVERRVERLQAAADAGVPGAVADLLAQGPDGQSIDAVWGDPRHDAWKRQAVAAVTAAGARGDAAALALLARLYASGRLPDADGAATLTYAVTSTDATAAREYAHRPAERERFLAEAAGAWERLGTALPPGRRAEAIAAGHALVAGS